MVQHKSAFHGMCCQHLLPAPLIAHCRWLYVWFDFFR